MTNIEIATDIKLAGIRRGSKDPKRSAEFYAWLLGLKHEPTGERFRLACANGDLTIHADVSTPVAFELDASKKEFRGHDLDGVPVDVMDHYAEAREATARLDHISLVCEDLSETIDFYRRLGFVLTWSGAPPSYEKQIHGVHEQPVSGADWVHLSAADGYLALAQADWQDFGIHNSNSGPPRFIHVGFEVQDVAAIAARLDAAGIPHSRNQKDFLGERIYLNDPDGDASLGNNVELIEYQPGVSRSGKLPY